VGSARLAALHRSSIEAAVYTSPIERVIDFAIGGFLWGFRLVVVLVVVVGSILTLTGAQFSGEIWIRLVTDGLTLGSVYALIALGYTMVYGILRMINFAHGEIFMSGAFGGYFAATFLNGAGLLNGGPLLTFLSIGIMIVVAMAVSATLALLVERVAYRPLRNAPRLVPLITAIGASFFLQYSFRGFLGPGIYAYPSVPLLEEDLVPGIIQLRVIDVLVVGATILMMLGLYLFVTRTKTGTAMRAVSEDMATASLMGIDVDRIIVTTFGIGAMMAGAAGVLYGLMFTQVFFFTGFIPGLKAFTAAVLGGIGNIPGAMLGGLFLGLTESIGPILFLSGLNVPSPNQLKDVIAFTMLVLILIFRPSGILGERLAAKRA
jgi:branched-chain amino acid transport system permease protein